MDHTKYDEMIENRINGNISDFNKAVNELSKLQLIDLIEHMRGYHGIKPNAIAAWLRTAFNQA